MGTHRVHIGYPVRELVLTSPCREEVKKRCFSTHLFGGQNPEEKENTVWLSKINSGTIFKRQQRGAKVASFRGT